MWTDSIFSCGGQPPNDRIPCVFRTPIGVFFGSGRFFRNDRVLESCRFERRLPRFDTRLKVWDPLLWRRRIDVIDDRFYRFRYLDTRVFFFQPVSCNESASLSAMFIAAVIDGGVGEVTDPLIE